MLFAKFGEKLEFSKTVRNFCSPNLRETGILQNWKKLLFAKFVRNWTSPKLGENEIFWNWEKLLFAKFGKNWYSPTLVETAIHQICKKLELGSQICRGEDKFQIYLEVFLSNKFGNIKKLCKTASIFKMRGHYRSWINKKTQTFTGSPTISNYI